MNIHSFYKHIKKENEKQTKKENKVNARENLRRIRKSGY